VLEANGLVCIPRYGLGEKKEQPIDCRRGGSSDVYQADRAVSLITSLQKGTGSLRMPQNGKSHAGRRTEERTPISPLKLA